MRLAIVTRPKPDAAGTLPLYVRVEHGGLTRYVSLALRLPARAWNPRKREVRSSHPGAARWNQLLASRLSAAQDAALSVQASGRHFTADRVRDAVEAALHPSLPPVLEEAPRLIPYLREAVRAYEGRGQVATAYAYASGISSLEAFARPGIGFEDVTPALVRAWQSKMTTEGKSLNTIHKYVSAVRTMVRQAVEEGVPGAASAVQALKAAKLRKERVHKVRLTLEHVRAIQALPLEGRRADVRDWYVFAFYLGGMRFSDVALLRWADVDRSSVPWRVRWRQRKTGDPHTLLALGPAQGILERRVELGGSYVFGLVTAKEAADAKTRRTVVGRWNALANKYLYEMQAAVGAPRAGFHSARHSLADHLRRSGLSIYDISKALGHANIRVTEAYLASFDAEDLDAKLERLLEG